ncbi:MAG: YihY family inner membrane protein [Pseudomonadales bacterium]|jgi:membrane protein|nr:YihY family inner membrane protein [Pseudomonadales bacterium]
MSRTPARHLQDAARALVDFVRYVAHRFMQNGGTETAAALTYTTLFAVVPFMTVTYSLLSAVEAFEGVGDRVREFLFSNFVPAAGEAVEAKLIEFSEQARQLTAIGTAFLVVTAFMMLVNVEKAFNRIWRVREPRRGVSRFLLYWGVLTLSPLLIGLGFAISSYLFSLPLIQGTDGFGVRERLLRMLPFLFSCGAFTVLYAAVPNTRVRLAHAFLGGVLTMLAFESAKHGFALVMKRSTVEVIYGTFAAVPLFLGWVFLTWTIVLLGAEIVAALPVHRHASTRSRTPVLLRVLELLFRVHRQHRAGGALTDLIARPVLEPLGPDLAPELLAKLEESDFLRRDADGNWLPGRDYAMVRVIDLVRALPGPVPDALPLDEDAPPWHRLLGDRLEMLRETRERALGLSLSELFASTLGAAEATGAKAPSSSASAPGLTETEKKRA